MGRPSVISLAVVALALSCTEPEPPRRPPPRPACAGEVGHVVVVDTGKRRLHLCRGAESERWFPVALGSGGGGKTREGDARTPLGRYTLSPPRESYSGYHRFVPIGYPTAAQREAGFTGGAVGIHGPSRAAAGWGEATNTAVNYTLGCIALGSDAAIEAVEDWIVAHEVTAIHLR